MRSSIRPGGGVIELAQKGASLIPGSLSALTPGALSFGINSNHLHSSVWVPRKVVYDRSNNLDVPYTATPESVSIAVGASLAEGCIPLVIINTPDKEVLGKIPVATYSNNAIAIIERVRADHPTVKRYELINEPYYKGSEPNGSKISSNGTVYGKLVKPVYEKAIAKGWLTEGVDLLLASYGEYNTFASLEKEEKQEQSGVFFFWVRDVTEVFKETSDIRNKITGWTTHPYGNLGAANGEKNNNWGCVEVHRAKAIEQGGGGTNNWWITEIGWKTEEEQVNFMKLMLEKAVSAHNAGWLQGLIIYHDGGDAFNIFGKPAQGVLSSFAETYG